MVGALHGDRLCGLSRARENDHGLVSRVREARQLALERLLQLRTPSGRWIGTFDVSGFFGAIYIIMMRTTGVIELPDSCRVEALLALHITNQANPDGGFFKYPGSPSSRSVTGVVLMALRMVTGETAPGHGPEGWFRPNERVDEGLSGRLRETIAGAGRFLRDGKKGTSLSFEYTHVFMERILRTFVDPRESAIPLPFLRPEILAWMRRSRILSRVHNQFHPLLRRILPAISVLYHGIQEQRSITRPTLARLKRAIGFQRVAEKSVQELARCILAEQNENGGWVYNSLYTMLNVMALHKAGFPLDHPSICRALQFLRGEITLAPDGGLSVNFFRTDFWDTCLGVASYLRIPGHTCLDKEIYPSIEFMLQSQNQDGGFAMASGSRNDPDNDSTALALRVLSIASETADEPLHSRIRRALEAGRAYLLPRQDRQGGFSAIEDGLVKKGGAFSNPIKHSFFDMPSPDVTARILYGLCEIGLSEKDQPVRKALRFLINTQRGNGAWWCRWWAGYISGTDFVLDAISRLGLRYGPNPFRQDKLLTGIHDCMMKAISFILQHQNPNGGWGETIEADFDVRSAGRGESRPLQTASVLFDLLACGYPVDSPEIQRGYEYLLGVMTCDGRWEDDQATFTVIPRSFYYPYPFMNYVLPLNAMTAHLKACQVGGMNDGDSGHGKGEFASPRLCIPS